MHISEFLCVNIVEYYYYRNFLSVNNYEIG